MSAHKLSHMLFKQAAGLTRDDILAMLRAHGTPDMGVGGGAGQEKAGGTLG